jgi:hypothetical protein
MPGCPLNTYTNMVHNSNKKCPACGGGILKTFLEAV